jgi:ATP-dependent Clp protease ATP-binding subunit ClpX
MLFLTSCLLWFVYWRFIKGIKPIKGEYKKIGHGSKLKRLLVDFPRQLMHDRLTFDPDFFRESGVHIVAGKQGCGKTVTVVYLLMWFKLMYPKLKVKTNFEYKHQDGEICHWQDVIESENGIYGEIDVIDEIQNWFNSLQSKDFPIEMMTEITQQRKQKKIILGTSQVFNRVAKPIREQTYCLYKPFTIAGCLTVVLKFEPVIKADSGTPDKNNFRGLFFFVHNQELRESYDTYKKIQKMAKSGFKPTPEHITSTANTAFTIDIKDYKKKKHTGK